MAAPTPNSMNPLSWNVATSVFPADVPTSARKSSSPSWRSNWLACPVIDHSIGPVLPIALSTSAIIRIPPVSPGEKDSPPPKEIFSLPNSTPSTIPIAIGKKSVSDNFFASFPISAATPCKPSFSPTTISLSPNFSSRLAEGERSIPLRRTRVTVQPKLRCRFRSQSCFPIISFLVSSSDSMLCVLLNGNSPSSREPSISARLFSDSSLPTACIQSSFSMTVCAFGIMISCPRCSLEMIAPVIDRTFNCMSVRPNTVWLLTLNRQVLSSGN